MQQEEKQEEEKLGKVMIPESLAGRIEKRLPSTEFKTVNQYVIYVLQEVLNELEAQEKDKEMEMIRDQRDNIVFSEEEEEQVKERLKDLGYL